MPQSDRVNLGKLMVQQNVTLRELMLAGAQGTAVWALNLGDPVDQDRAEQAIQIFNTLCGTNYTIFDIEVVLCTEATPCYLHRPKLPSFAFNPI